MDLIEAFVGLIAFIVYIRALTNNMRKSIWPDLRSAALVVNGQHKIFAS